MMKFADGKKNQDNAYVSGMKEDLGFEGNQLVELQTMYTVGAVVGQIPSMFLFTFVPMNYLIPFLDVCWGVFTLLQYRATGFAELAAYRFLVGGFEVCFEIVHIGPGSGEDASYTIEEHYKLTREW